MASHKQGMFEVRHPEAGVTLRVFLTFQALPRELRQQQENSKSMGKKVFSSTATAIISYKGEQANGGKHPKQTVGKAGKMNRPRCLCFVV